MTVSSRPSASAGSGSKIVGRARRGAQTLIECYTELARTNEHLLTPILHGTAPVQWEHYPADDAVDQAGVYQWFYHSHSPADRPDSTEHGHFHLFARTSGIASVIASKTEKAFLEELSAGAAGAATRHLLCIGMSPTGVPISLFTVNSWVTGDVLLSGPRTLKLLEALDLNTGYPAIDQCLTGLVGLYGREIHALVAARDEALRRRAASGSGTLDDTALEVLSSLPLQLDQQIEAVLA